VPLFDAPGSLDEVSTERGQRHGMVASGAFGERAVEISFEARQRAAHAGSRAPEFVSGASQGGIACDGDETLNA
jgi:hypothetical protein